MTLYSGDEFYGDDLTSGDCCCEHGFIGACAECDGSGQQPPEEDDGPRQRYACLTCEAVTPPMTAAEAEAQRLAGHDLEPL